MLATSQPGYDICPVSNMAILARPVDWSTAREVVKAVESGPGTDAG
jgi:hypothetical protein